MTTTDRTITAAQVEALEGHLALRVVARLNERTAEFPHDIGERLRVAREQAVQRAQAQRRLRTVPVAAVQVHASGTAALGGSGGWWLRAAALLPLVVLVAGLVLIQQRHDADQIAAAAEIDAALLADELPPEAYSDPGFVEFLKAPPAP